MKNMIPGKLPRPIKSSKFLLACALFIVSGCAHNPDIRVGHDTVDGITSKDNNAYMDCIRNEVKNGVPTFTVENNGKTDLFFGSTDPTTTEGLVELSSANGHNTYSAYQRDAWYDRGRLLDAAQACSKT
uniref:hypothetical protein n=1 Tax=Pseudomonas laurentiana TaxID=2364649 RepID=UPI0029C8639B|nr:hypothetical protein [Pseudomonas laurentiana]